MAFHVPEKYRRTEGAGAYNSDASYGNNGAFVVPGKNRRPLTVIASDGEGWEHVSVSARYRCPTWGEMTKIKNLFWNKEDTVIQFHPPESEYVNCHPFTLHLWRKIGEEVATPPFYLVGPKTD